MTGSPDDRGRDAHLEELIERSSLGTPGARQLRARIPIAEAKRIARLAGSSVGEEEPRRVPEQEPLLTTAQAAAKFGVPPKFIVRWAKAGKLTSIRTPGGHRRYREAEVRVLIERMTSPQQRPEEGIPARDHGTAGEESAVDTGTRAAADPYPGRHD